MPKVIQVHKDQKEIVDFKALKGSRVIKENKGHKGHKAQEAIQALKGTKATVWNSLLNLTNTLKK